MEARPSRVVIENVGPSVDGGRFPIKRVVGEVVEVRADIHADGHDVLAAVVRHRAGDGRWRETPMEPLGNDVWLGTFGVDRLVTHEYAVEAWIDPYATWRRDLEKRVAAGQPDVDVDLRDGARLLREAAARTSGADAAALEARARLLEGADGQSVDERVDAGLDPATAVVACRHPDRSSAAASATLEVAVDRELAGFGAWYEFFPRSRWDGAEGHATLRECESRLGEIARLGFDIVYLPPIHPIGRTHRKGRNNAPRSAGGDVGSPWAIGSVDGGHTAVHPDLGTLEDFDRFVARAAEHGLEVALDLAFQCSPDHPWVKEHPGWFRRRADGSIRHAENPPKKYEDIYPIDFECDDWQALWRALGDVVEFWVARGIKVFRVDNPHTKPYPFWQWLIGEVRGRHPEVFFLSEAFTRPKVMARLAKIGFSQSYTYFTWRNTARELRDYVEQLTRSELREYFRPNFWPNTPDILSEYLQAGGRPAFLVRLIAAATLSPSYGLYGPAFELCEREPIAPGREEYLDSEKYQVRSWDLTAASDVRAVIARINRIRRDNPALRSNADLRFHTASDDDLLVFSKHTRDASNTVIVVLNLDPHHTRSGWVELDGLGLERGHPFQMHDLVTGARYFWSGPRNYVELDPRVMPAHVFRVRRRLRTEKDFDYYL